MGSRQSTTYFCDVCKQDLVGVPSSKLAVTAGLEGEWAMEFSIKWHHFCNQCRAETIDFFQKMTEKNHEKIPFQPDSISGAVYRDGRKIMK